MKLLFLIFGLSLLASESFSAPLDPQSLNQPGLVLMLRHAKAPGFGDPPHFDLKDCSTQRNLSEVGREQAREIGVKLRGLGIKEAKVYSSQWCRCLETARLLNLGEVTELWGLNSFFQMPESREPNLTMLKAFLENQSETGELVVLVTHYVTISAISGYAVGSGEGVLLKLTGEGYTPLGKIAL